MSDTVEETASVSIYDKLVIDTLMFLSERLEGDETHILAHATLVRDIAVWATGVADADGLSEQLTDDRDRIIRRLEWMRGEAQ
jgi:hypothetical protein